MFSTIIPWWLFAAFCSVVIYGIWWFVQPWYLSSKNRHPLAYDQFYVNTELKSGPFYARIPLPSLFSPSSVQLSIIVPAYNEEKRLPLMLEQTLQYLNDRTRAEPSFTSEIVIVDDGSSDKTAALVCKYSEMYTSNKIRLLKLPHNMGKGGAVQQGALHARGELILFADADGASDITCFNKVEDALKAVKKGSLGVAIGSRAHLQSAEDVQAQRSGLRTFLMKSFHALVANVSGLHHIKDTQCGFKLFTRETALVIFGNQRIQRWCFDVELLYLAKELDIPVAEVPINWEEVDGSKVQIMDASLTMARDLFIIRGCYTFGLWKIEKKDALQRYLPIVPEDFVSQFKI